MMFKSELAVAAVWCLALVQADGVLDSLPSCAKPCFTAAEAASKCDLSKLSCLCSALPQLTSSDTVRDCLVKSCSSISTLASVQPMLEKACAGTSSVSSTSTAVLLTASASYPTHTANSTGGMYPNGTATATGVATVTSATDITTSAPTAGSGSTPPGTTSMAGRPALSLAALGVAMAALLCI